MSECIDQNLPVKKHAKLSASGSSRWLNCPGSVKAEEKYPNTSSKDAQKGTAAHEVADLCLKSGEDAEVYEGKTILDIEIDYEIVTAVQKYLDYVRAFETSSTTTFYEERVDFSNVVPNGFGTLDASVIDYENRVCHIFDYKNGRIFVDAVANTQGQLYALGLLNELGFLDAFDTFVIHIVQPNASNFASWEISVEDLEKFGKYVKERAELALSNNAKRYPSEKACLWCRAKSDCKALFNHTQEVIGKEFDNLDEDSETMTHAEKRLILDNKKMIEMFLASVETSVEKTLLDGEKFEGYKLIMGKTNRKYKDSAEKFLIKELGEEKAYRKELIPLTQAEKLVYKEALAEHLYKPQGTPKLAKESAKGEDLANIADEFETIEGEG